MEMMMQVDRNVQKNHPLIIDNALGKFTIYIFIQCGN